ncbi:MAG: T9SS type A sorting domain-containing protein, partial [Flavobacteriales bacterium]|nr:T9SS type A sorting domain-containing protein [Flavobacteriales bacterium]
TGLQLLNDPTLNSFTQPVRSINWVDYDNNGTKDLFVTLGFVPPSWVTSVRLFKQELDGSFLDVTNSSQIGPVEISSYGSSWVDYDRDGFLDLYVNHYNTEPNLMYHNNGDGTFEELALDLKLQDLQGVSFTSLFFDADLDGVLDLFIANDRLGSLNSFYKGNVDGTFTDLSDSSKVNVDMDAMGADVGDYDNDGDLDIYVANSSVAVRDSVFGNVMFRNEGNMVFTPLINHPFNVDYAFFWGCLFIDYDYDRDLDLFTVAAARDLSQRGRLLFENDGLGAYSLYPGEEFMPDQGLHYGAAKGDLTGDGWTDLGVLDMAVFRSQIWKNPAGTNNWISLHLEGTVSNRDAIGSLIEVWVNGTKRIDQTTCGNSYASQDSDNYPFGIGTFPKADSVIIRWPNGHVNAAYDLLGGERHVLVEDTSTYVISPFVECSSFSVPVDLTKSFDPVNGIQDRVQVKWYKESPQVKYMDEDAAACDIKFWPKRNLDPLTGNPIGPVIQDPDTINIIDAKKSYGDGSPRSIFKWPIKFRADGANNSKRAEANMRYQWQVRCACDHGAGPESPWSEVKIFNTPDFDPQTGIYNGQEGIANENGDLKKDSENSGIERLIIYPNPSYTGWIRIASKSEFSGSYRYSIHDITGKVIRHDVLALEKGGTKITIDIRGISAGEYLIRLLSDDMVSEARFSIGK